MDKMEEKELLRYIIHLIKSGLTDDRIIKDLQSIDNFDDTTMRRNLDKIRKEIIPIW